VKARQAYRGGRGNTYTEVQRKAQQNYRILQDIVQLDI
jgi:hypothetical protein